MLNIISEVNAWLKTRTTPYAPIVQNAWSGISEEIMTRTDPSSIETRYFDGTRVGTLNFSYYAKSKNQQTARNQLDTIINVLDLQNVDITDALMIANCKALTVPVYVEKTTASEHIWTASFTLEYINNKEA